MYDALTAKPPSWVNVTRDMYLGWWLRSVTAGGLTQTQTLTTKNQLRSATRHEVSRSHLQSVYHSFDMRLHCLMRKLGAGQRAHAFQSQVAQVGFSVLQELAELVAGSYQQGGLAERQDTTMSRSAHFQRSNKTSTSPLYASVHHPSYSLQRVVGMTNGQKKHLFQSKVSFGPFQYYVIILAYLIFVHFWTL